MPGVFKRFVAGIQMEPILDFTNQVARDFPMALKSDLKSAKIWWRTVRALARDVGAP
jgi:hypothetical protein